MGDIIWDFDDGINDHEFLIISIDNQFTLLQSWIHLWSMESWLGEDLQFPNFYPRGYRFKDMDTDTLEKMRNFHKKMGKGQFFSFETFWNYFEKYYGEFIQAMAICSSENFLKNCTILFLFEIMFKLELVIFPLMLLLK